MKDILLAVSDIHPGLGDFFFAFKLSKQIKDHAISMGKTPPNVYVVTRDKGKERCLDADAILEYETPILTTSELQEEIQSNSINPGLILEGPIIEGTFIKQIDLIMSQSSEPPSLHTFGEYNYISNAETGYRNELSHLKFNALHRTGFPENLDFPLESGVLVEKKETRSATSAFRDIDNKIQNKLAPPADFSPSDAEITHYLNTTNMSLAYSNSMQIDVLTYKMSAGRFISLHTQYIEPDSKKNEDVFLVTPNIAGKTAAKRYLRENIELLKEKGFKQIEVHDLDTGEEENFFNSAEPGKIYRLLLTSSLPHKSMTSISELSGPLAGATGDQSFIEAISKGKMVVYECLDHKKTLIKNFDSIFQKLVEKYWEHDDDLKKDLIELFTLVRTANKEKDYRRAGELFHKKSVKEALKSLPELANQILQNHDLFTNVIAPVLEDSEYYSTMGPIVAPGACSKTAKIEHEKSAIFLHAFVAESSSAQETAHSKQETTPSKDDDPTPS